MNFYKILVLGFSILSVTASAQEKDLKAFNPKYLNWYNSDYGIDNVLGSSVNKTYQEILPGMKAKKTVTVAIIDGGVDINNEDLKGRIWINADEIAGNNIDDDHNGYVDDVNGWNFIGNAKGENVLMENLEYTRVYKMGAGAKDYELAKKLYNAEFLKRIKEKETLRKFEEKYNKSKQVINDKTGVEVTKPEDLASVKSEETSVLEAVDFLQQRYVNGFTEASFQRRKKRNTEYLENLLNVDFTPRTLVGDNPEDINDTHYGNPDVKGPRASHGTCLAGIIAGIRNNAYGVDGIASDVKIMVLRTTPNGDERDKDVALAIRYAVENGADIINMSFGKAISPQKNFVDEAIRLAEKKNVLIVHAAGNEGSDIEQNLYYPSGIYLDNTEATNFLNVGASGMEKGQEVPAFFSNYGAAHVHLFAPGEDIISLDTSNTFSLHSGTSQAAPVVTGVAALLLSYYPELTPQKLIALLQESGLNLRKQKVLQPNLVSENREKIKFGKLSKSGAIVNAYNAFKIVESIK